MRRTAHDDGTGAGAAGDARPRAARRAGGRSTPGSTPTRPPTTPAGGGTDTHRPGRHAPPADHQGRPLPHPGEKIVAVTRAVPKVTRIGAETVKALVGGPTAVEAADGFGTAIPEDPLPRPRHHRRRGQGRPVQGLRVGRGQPLPQPAPGPGDVHPRPVRQRHRCPLPPRRRPGQRLLGQRDHPRPARELRRLRGVRRRHPARDRHLPRHLAVHVPGGDGRLPRRRRPHLHQPGGDGQGVRCPYLGMVDPSVFGSPTPAAGGRLEVKLGLHHRRGRDRRSPTPSRR